MKKILKNQLVYIILIFIGSYITARSEIGGLISPLNVAVCGALPPYIAVTVMLGTLISYVFGGLIGTAIVYIAAIILITGIAFFYKKKITANFSAILTALAMIVSVSCVSIYAHSTLTQIITGLVISMITGFCAYCIRDFYSNISTKKSFTFKGKTGGILTLIFMLTAVTLFSLNFSIVNIGCIFVTIVILFAIKKHSHLGGFITGGLSSCAAMFYSVQIGVYLSFLGLIGYVLGFFGKINKYTLSLLYLCANTFVICMIGYKNETVRLISGMFLGTMIFVYLPVENLGIFSGLETDNGSNLKEINSARLHLMSNSILKVKSNAEKMSNVFLRESTNNKTKNTIRQLQNLLYGQMEISAELIGNIETGLSDDVRYDFMLSNKLSKLLNKNNVDFATLIAFYNEKNHLFIEVYFHDFEYNPETICEIFSKEMGMEIINLEPVISHEQDKIVFMSYPVFKLDYSVYQSCAVYGEDNGDNYSVFYDGGGNVLIALSDGMGTGERASLESKMLINHLKRLVKSGVSDVKTAMRIINNLMFVEDDDEVFATLDLCKINLDNGETRLYKYAASSTIIKQENEIRVVNNASFPVGILDKNIEPYIENITLTPGDLIVMLSDGVPEKEYKNIQNLLMRSPRNLELLAKRIGEQARASSNDDITVIILSIS